MVYQVKLFFLGFGSNIDKIDDIISFSDFKNALAFANKMMRQRIAGRGFSKILITKNGSIVKRVK